MKILVSYRGIPQSPGWATCDMIVRAFRALGHEVMPYGHYYQAQMGRLEDRSPFDEDWDLFLFMECGDGDPTYTELASLRSRKRASWFFDAALYPHKWLEIVRLFDFDVNFIANNNMLYANLKTHFLPYAADDTLHYRPYTPKTRKLGFIGSDRPDRQRLAHKLGIELKSGIFREQFIDYMASCHYIVNDIAGGGAGLIPMRPFEALAAGAELITPQNDGCRALGLPCLEYSCQEELVSICATLQNDGLLPNYNGQANVLSNHTYKHRCDTILKAIFPNEMA